MSVVLPIVAFSGSFAVGYVARRRFETDDDG